MFRTNRMSEDINWIYIILLRKFDFDRYNYDKFANE